MIQDAAAPPQSNFFLNAVARTARAAAILPIAKQIPSLLLSLNMSDGILFCLQTPVSQSSACQDPNRRQNRKRSLCLLQVGKKSGSDGLIH
jgi:hypothetical protein